MEGFATLCLATWPYRLWGWFVSVGKYETAWVHKSTRVTPCNSPPRQAKWFVFVQIPSPCRCLSGSPRLRNLSQHPQCFKRPLPSSERHERARSLVVSVSGKRGAAPIFFLCAFWPLKGACGVHPMPLFHSELAVSPSLSPLRRPLNPTITLIVQTISILPLIVTNRDDKWPKQAGRHPEQLAEKQGRRRHERGLMPSTRGRKPLRCRAS